LYEILGLETVKSQVSPPNQPEIGSGPSHVQTGKLRRQEYREGAKDAKRGAELDLSIRDQEELSDPWPSFASLWFSCPLLAFQ
jgi:hypothetical protein